MDEGSGPWLICLLLILFADFIAIAETALASVSKVRMKILSDHGDSRAVQVLDALENFDRTISTILICTNIAHMAIASIVTVAVTRRWGLSYVSISTVITSLVVFFAAEMLPKSIAKKYSEPLALWSIPFLSVLIRVFSPLSALLAKIGSLASELVKDDQEASVTEDEIYDIIEDMEEEGSLDEEASELISSAMQFNTITVESVLTPRVDVVGIDINSDPARTLDLIKNSNHSRLPVYEGTIDNVIGILRIRRYIPEYLRDREHVDLRALMDKPLFVTENANIDELLTLMSKERQNLAVVTDHYGGTVGIISVEDILEELVGDLWDENDKVELPVQNLGKGYWLVDPEVLVGDLFNELDFEDPEKDEELENEKAGEWVYSRFSSIPKANEGFEYHGMLVSIAQMEHNRIRKIRVKLPEKTEEGEQA